MLLISTQVKQSAHGLGLFTQTRLTKGQKIWEFDDLTEIVISKFDLQRAPDIFKEFVSTYGYYVESLGVIINIDNSRFMNHSDNPNLIEIDGCNYATRDIEIGEELTCDYKVFDNDLIFCGNFLDIFYN